MPETFCCLNSQCFIFQPLAMDMLKTICEILWLACKKPLHPGYWGFVVFREKTVQPAGDCACTLVTDENYRGPWFKVCIPGWKTKIRGI